MPRTVEAIEKLSWEDMNAIFAAHFASEIEAVTEYGGEVAVRERVAARDEEQQQLLRGALAHVEVG